MGLPKKSADGENTIAHETTLAAALKVDLVYGLQHGVSSSIEG